MSKSLLTARELALIDLMVTVTCILGPIALPIPFSPMPITFGNLALFLAVYVLGMKDGFIGYMIYFLTGIADPPVFSGFLGGIGKVAGPTGGCLIGFSFMILITGYFTDKYHAKKGPSIAGMAPSALVCDLAETMWLSHQLGISFLAGLGSSVVPYLPGDLMKIIAASFLGPELRKAVDHL